MIPEESDTIEIPESLVTKDGNDNIYSTKSRGVDEKVYTYDEAIDLTGNLFY